MTAHRVAPIPLSELRKRLSQSQATIARAIGTNQSGVSRIERQADILVSTLSHYVSALGGTLRLVVNVGGEEIEVVLPALAQEATVAHKEFRVIWQDLQTRSFVHVGWLVFDGQMFSFTYTNEARSNPSFDPFPSFPDLHATYRSADLFPFFSARLTASADPGFETIIDSLGLTKAEASPAELLAGTRGDSPHDTIQVIPEPEELPDGTVVRVFLASGVRHAHPGASDAVSALKPGDRLEIRPEPKNPANPRALHLTASDSPVGWVPDYLLEEVCGHLNAGRIVDVTVERANGPSAPWHLRLLCRMSIAADQSSE
jgi:transcriptional regulator with XRE-family HTH domain